MAKYFLTNKAVDELAKIYEYTYESWFERQADKYYEELIDYCQLLSENPSIGKNYREIESELHGFVVNKHIIFYRISGNLEIEIVRILEAEMDLKNRLKD